MTLLTAADRRLRGAAVRDARPHRRLARRSVPPARLWVDAARQRCCCWPASWSRAPLVVALQTLLKHQTLAGNLPMRLRWNFHRLMLGQSMGFYQDEFAGRIATKVMQTALAVRETLDDRAPTSWSSSSSTSSRWSRVAGGFDRWLLLPFLGWLALYVAALCVLRAAAGQGRPGAGRRALADDRPHHRRLHQHRHRQAVLARAAARPASRAARCRSSWSPRYAQMRLVSGFEIVNHAAQHGADRRHRRRRAVAVVAAARSASARSPRRPRWRCA